ncbi:PREDICTED: uncharacterized protein LOC104814327 [Tarenaya hassleriana]|uniref:uncharacterized protein LOC104814327 n=1 Tax=Tarenaya hassleriana TaxID=28532 RepID=UPI00053CA3B3|nr:PREDICTED: uncharacterized protein LOC104814327 [Tarenaya hassleriana]
MASPQVEIVSAQNFGCVLRDRNQRADNVFEKNLKALVKDHHHHHHHYQQQQRIRNRISAESAISDLNTQNRIDSWIENQQQQNRSNRLRPPEFYRPKKDGIFSDGSSQTTQKHFPKESANLPPKESIPRRERPENSKRNEPVGASSLVQIWEARLIRSNGGNPPIQDQSTASSSWRSSGANNVQETLCLDGESEPDGESKNPDQTLEIESGSSCSVSDSGESKWGRVSDIIKQLSNEQKQIAGGVIGLPTIRTPRPCLSSCSSTLSEKTLFPVVACSPRIRGRQAFADLLMQLERDRHHELDSLRERNSVSKFPQRGRLQSMLRLRTLQRCIAIQDRHSSNVKTARQETGSAVMHLRERFRVNPANSATSSAIDRRNDMSKEVDRETTVAESSRQSKETGNLPEASMDRKVEKEEANLPKNDDTAIGEDESKRTCHAQETANEENAMWEKKEGLYLERQETSSLNEWEGYEDEQSYYGDTNYDWFSEISRPRSYWEDLRKNRYMEVMNNTPSGKEDICRLLERRTVSSFLESDLRENIDRLMMSRVQRQPIQRVEERTDRWEITRESNLEEEEVEDEKVEDGREEEEEGDQIEAEEGQESDDSSHSSSQMFLPSPGGIWSSRDTGVTSTPLLPVHNHHSLEMDLINELRAQIQQLQREMTELSDTVNTCMDANSRLQQSVHQENPLKRKCCVCNQTQVESLLYRCGHMCTCLKCANELQWKGGKCPICHAQILDVVRVFF